MLEKLQQPFEPASAKGLRIESIISAPLVAAATANGMMLKEQTQFLMHFCFTKINEVYEPVMIEMSLDQRFVDTNSEKQVLEVVRSTFQIPLITIIPINSLAVENVLLNFSMDIVSQNEGKQSHSITTSNNSENDKKPVLRGKVGIQKNAKNDQSHTTSTRRTTQLDVKVEAGTLPLPIGLSTILDLYVKSIQPTKQKTLKPKKKDKS
jgi:hypothetical protein